MKWVFVLWNLRLVFKKAAKTCKPASFVFVLIEQSRAEKHSFHTYLAKEHPFRKA